VCPDGRAYVGAVNNIRDRADKIGRSNLRMVDALKQYPPEMWAFEVPEQPQPGCSLRDLRIAEQRQMDRLRSWMPEHGFNMAPAVSDGDGPHQRAWRKYLRKFSHLWRKRTRSVQKRRQDRATKKLKSLQRHANSNNSS
jgi:hypothetical protein